MLDSTPRCCLRWLVRTAIGRFALGTMISLIAVALSPTIHAQSIDDPDTIRFPVSCAPNKVAEAKLGISISQVIFEIEGCACWESAEAAKSFLTSLSPAQARSLIDRIDSGKAEGTSWDMVVELGQTEQETIYCYEIESVRALLGEAGIGDNSE